MIHAWDRFGIVKLNKRGIFCSTPPITYFAGYRLVTVRFNDILLHKRVTFVSSIPGDDSRARFSVSRSKNVIGNDRLRVAEFNKRGTFCSASPTTIRRDIGLSRLNLTIFHYDKRATLTFGITGSDSRTKIIFDELKSR